jgi:Swt1-like HEPN
MVFHYRPTLNRRGSATVAAGLRSGITSDSVAAFVRWWQIETWLRTLVHLELSAKYGTKWPAVLGLKFHTLAKKNTANAYMLSPDDDDLLSYGDITDLFKIIEDDQYWPLFEKSLVPKVRWIGWTDELRAIRNRVAHCRRPHSDDLDRLEQVLRNLERGAKATLRYYEESIDAPASDAVAQRWLGKNPPWQHIRDHARGQYRTNFGVWYSKRPWADVTSSLTGTPGVLVHAQWSIRDGFVFPDVVWNDLKDQGLDLALVVHYVQDVDSRAKLVFAAVDDHDAVATAIETAFQAVIGNIERFDENESYHGWTANAGTLDPRCHIDDAFAHSDRLELFSIFNAGTVTPGTPRRSRRRRALG